MTMRRVVNAKKAYWIHRTHIIRDDEYECSSCGNIANKPYKACPYCGLPMKGLKSDHTWVDELEMIDEIMDE